MYLTYKISYARNLGLLFLRVFIPEKQKDTS